MENEVYAVFQDYGSWDDYAYNLAGVFTNQADAEAMKDRLTAGLEKFHNDFPRPKEDTYYDPAYPNANEAWVYKYSEDESAWYKAVFAAEMHDMMSVNSYSVKALPLNELFAEYNYFLND
jgi:hypothetical protein